MKYLFDTNVQSDFVRGEPAVTTRLRREAPQQSAVSVITEMEIEYGLPRNPNLAPRVREAMRILLNTVSVVPFEREDARVAAQLRASLNSQRTPTGAYDMLLAACALRRGLKIVTHNAREFARIGGLGLEDWRSSQARSAQRIAPCGPHKRRRLRIPGLRFAHPPQCLVVPHRVARVFRNVFDLRSPAAIGSLLRA